MSEREEEEEEREEEERERRRRERGGGEREEEEREQVTLVKCETWEQRTKLSGGEQRASTARTLPCCSCEQKW